MSRTLQAALDKQLSSHYDTFANTLKERSIRYLSSVGTNSSVKSAKNFLLKGENFPWKTLFLNSDLMCYEAWRFIFQSYLNITNSLNLPVANTYIQLSQGLFHF